MNEQDYLENRLNDQLQYFEAKSTFNQKRYRVLKLMVIIMSVSIPFLSGLIEKFGFPVTLTVGLLGVGIAMIEGIQQLYKYQENWTNYRRTAEKLKREQALYLTKSGPYKSGSSVQLLAERVESLLENENNMWLEYISAESEASTTE